MNNTMQNYYKSLMPISVPFLAEYPDLTASSITLLLTILLSIGVKESSRYKCIIYSFNLFYVYQNRFLPSNHPNCFRFNNVFTLLNLCVVIFVVVAGLSAANTDNWHLPSASNITDDTNKLIQKRGNGGFFPFGLSGTLSGAATCFYGFVGFDAIATTGIEEVNRKSLFINYFRRGD